MTARAEDVSGKSDAGHQAARAPSHPGFCHLDLHPRESHESYLTTVSAFAASIFKQHTERPTLSDVQHEVRTLITRAR